MKLLRRVAGYKFILSPIKISNLSRRTQLRNIIEYANNSPSFYKGNYKQFLASENDLSDEEFFYAFSHLPITSKQDLNPQNNRLISNILQRDAGALSLRRTNNATINDLAQSFIQSFNISGWKQGQRIVIFLSSNSHLSKLSKNRYKTLENYFGISVISYDEITKENTLTLLNTLKQKKTSLLITSPTALHKISEVMFKENIPPFEYLPFINVSGEFFLECSKSFIQNMFPDSDIQSTYSGKIFGNIAHQKNLHGHDYAALNDFTFLEQGHKNTILITQYTQCSPPLIRYQTNDVGKVINNDDGLQIISNLEGKSDNYIVGADGCYYYPSFFNSFINEVNSLYKDQIIHFNLRYCERYDEKYMQVNFTLNNMSKRDKVKNAAQETFFSIFADYSHIDIRFNDTIHHDPNNKFKLVAEDTDLSAVIKKIIQAKSP